MKYFGRQPESRAVVDAWISAFRNGTTNEDVIAGFLGPEYFQNQLHYNNITVWLFSAYQDVLDRQVFQAGVSNPRRHQRYLAQAFEVGEPLQAIVGDQRAVEPQRV